MSNITITIITIVSILIAIIGLIFMVWSRHKYRFKVQKRTINLIQAAELNDISVFYKNNNVPDVSISKIAFWNGGNQTIELDDIASRDPIIFSINENYSIQDISIIKCTDEKNDISIEKLSEKQYKLVFDYIKPKEGCLIQIIHTSTRGSDVIISGTLKKGNDLSKFNSSPSKSKIINYFPKHSPFRSTFYLLYIALSILFFSIIITIISLSTFFSENYNLLILEPSTNRYIYLVVAIIFSTISVIYIFLFYKIFKRFYMPKIFIKEFYQSDY